MRKLLLASLGLLGLAAVPGFSAPAAAFTTDALPPAIERTAPVQDRVTVTQDQSEARRHRRPHRRHARRALRRPVHR